MSQELDRAFDHAAVIGSRIEVREMATRGDGACWRVRLDDESSGRPEGYGATVEQAAAALMKTIDGQIAHLEHLRKQETG